MAAIFTSSLTKESSPPLRKLHLNDPETDHAVKEQHKLKMHPEEESLSNSPEFRKLPPPNTPRMIVVSNRLPFVLKRNPNGLLERKSSAGGLVTAVAPVVIDCRGVWVGWTGLHDFNEKVDRIPESDPADMAPTAGLLSKQAMPVEIDSSAFELYYNGCCNETYWPLFHSMPDKAIFRTDYWDAYTKVNEIFAKKTMEAIRRMDDERHLKAILEGGNVTTNTDPPIVWVHDYHLMLAANTIRNICDEENISIRMGFFLHIPFPSFDIVRIFPWVDEVLMGILGCDLIGFHTEDYCLNFIDCCQRLLGCRIDKRRMMVQHQNRSVCVKALPIGIPYSHFEALSKIAKRVYPDGTRVILGVDRLDYTKGLVARLKALDRMFEEFPCWIGKVTFLQVAVPSRTDVPEYKELKESIDKLVGKINGKYSTPSWSPIRYIFGCVPQHDLVAYYRDSDVALVTPLRDGMNLVAKEFVAAQDDDNPGVLILSPFAGAGGLMHEALLANPYETLCVASALDRALKMPLDERKLRMNQLKKRERRMDVDAWVRGFLIGMASLHAPPDSTPLSGACERFNNANQGHLDICEGVHFGYELASDVESYTKLGIIVDFDGTLSYLARTPEQAFIPPETKKILERLSNMTDVSVVIISGREMKDLRRKVGVEGVTFAANHGMNILHPDGHSYQQSIPQDYKDRLRKLESALKSRVERDGAWVEFKDLLVAWHYREVDKDVKDILHSQARTIYESHGFDTLEVSKRLENIPPEGWDRGASCIHILRSLYGVDWEERVKVIYAGDSAADEIAIRRLKGVAYTFRVINEDSCVITKTLADYRLAGPGGVLNLLKFLEKRLVGKTPRTVSRASSVMSVDRDLLDSLTEELHQHQERIGEHSVTLSASSASQTHFRLRTNSQEAKHPVRAYRVRTFSQGSQGCGGGSISCDKNSDKNLRRKTLNHSLQQRISRDELHFNGNSVTSTTMTPDANTTQNA